MSENDRIRWEAKHADAAATALGEPEPTLAWAPAAAAHARALDLACGRGRHCGVLLARGYLVIAVDISAIALSQVRRRYPEAAERLCPLQADLDLWPFAPECFDLILQCDYLDRRLFPLMKASTRAGGHVLIDTFGIDGVSRSGPRSAAYRLEPGALQGAFEDWEILQRLNRSDPNREAILARKPLR